MTLNRPHEPEIRRCPNCNAINDTVAVICTSCGVSLGAISAANELIETRHAEQAVQRKEQWEANARQTLEEEVRLGRRRLWKQLRLLLVATLVLAVVTGLAASSLGYLERLRQERLAERYLEGVSCLQREQFRCARDALQEVNTIGIHYRDATNLLLAARLGLAHEAADRGYLDQALEELNRYLQQRPEDMQVRDFTNELRIRRAESLANQGQWASAVRELDQVLVDQPENERAYEMLQETYERWEAAEQAGGNIIQIIRVKLERMRRFFPEQE